MTIKTREVEVYKPYSNEAPEALLMDEGFSDVQIDEWLACDLLRLAKRGEDVLGLYAMNIADGETYQLLGIVMAPWARKQGVGRWLVGHALGVAESKGGRHVLFAGQAKRRFFGAIGFVSTELGQRFDIIPE